MVFLQNTIIDERSSLAVASPFPGPLASLFKSLEKVTSRCMSSKFVCYFVSIRFCSGRFNMFLSGTYTVILLYFSSKELVTLIIGLHASDIATPLNNCLHPAVTTKGCSCRGHDTS